MFPFIPNLVILHNVCSSSIIHLASFVCLVVVTFHGFFHGIHHYISPFGQICLELFTPTKSIKSNPSHPFMVYIPTFTNKNQPCKCRKIYRLSHGSESWISHPPRSSHPIGSIQGPSGRPGFDTILAWQPGQSSDELGPWWWYISIPWTMKRTVGCLGYIYIGDEKLPKYI